MYIAIKSELDSRVFVYPLMKALKSYGSMLVISSNRQLSRLLEDGEFGFRNISIIVDISGATDDIYNEYGIAPGDYDFVILDNVGAIEYDMCFILCGARSSIPFDEEIQILKEAGDTNIAIIQFGKKEKSSSQKQLVEKQNKKKEKIKDNSDNYNPASKFDDMVDISSKKCILKTYKANFPTFQDIEMLEAEHRFFEIDKNLVDAIYDTLKEILSVDKNQFQKEVRKKDESSGYIKSRNAMREE